MTTSIKIADKLYLVTQPVQNVKKAVPASVATNHVMVVDVSGSMSYELPQIRQHIKTKLPKLMREADTLSLIAFSGRGQFWRILTAEPIATLADLTDVNTAIDRWLRPVGLTGFKEPIEDAARVIAEVSKKNSNPFSLFFMSDGCDNQWSRAEIVKAVEATAPGLSAATVVEYGYYADRPLLTQMAERWGGSLCFSEDFVRFSPVLDAAIQRRVMGAKKIDVKVEGDPVAGLAWTTTDDEIVTYGLTGGVAGVPETTQTVYYLSSSPIGTDAKVYDIAPVYAAISLFAVRMRPDIVLPLLKVTGDVALIDEFAGCFGKQRYSAFQDHAKAAVFDETKRLTAGYNPNQIPRDDAFTVLDVLRVLQADDQNRVLLGHEAFRYGRIGRARVDANTRLSQAEQDELATLTDQLRTKRDVNDIKEINFKIAALTNKPEPLKFTEDDAGKDEGYPVSNLTYNEDRPNVSVLVRKDGTVDLSGRLPEQFKGKGLGKIPEQFRSFVFRNYTIVRDGIVNVHELPVRLSAETRAQLDRAVQDGRLRAGAIRTAQDGTTVLALSELPVTNRKSVQAVSARELFELHWDLTKARAAQKVYGAFLKELPGTAPKSQGFAALYGDDGAAWLAEQGLTDYSGFGPKVLTTEATDVYVAKQLAVKVKGYSTLPSLNDLRKQIEKGKLNGPGQLMRTAYDEVVAFLASQAVKKAANPDDVARTWLDGKATQQTRLARELLFGLAQLKTSVLVGQTWFTEFKSLDENSMELTFDKTKLAFTAVAEEYEEKV